MVFSSITFLLYFLPVVLILYFAVPTLKLKNIVLLIASLFFYAWGEPVYVVLMIISICGNYFCGKFLAGGAKNRKLKRYFIYAVAWNIAILFFFKYANMVIRIINGIFHAGISDLKLSLPIGISFYTFQALSYVIDVYKGKVKPQESLLAFALYVTMFPQLIAGPIVKYTDIEKSLVNRRSTYGGFGKGAEKFILGLGKKVLLANTLGGVFTQISGMAPETRSFLLVWLGAICYTFQIYFDFSGYSDMAIGLGYMFGFKFPVNFKYPYVAVSVTDFWRRWHISLSSWFRDYVYIPLGGNRVSEAKHIRNLLIVWGLTGLWHGASGNFIIWGLYYAFWLICEKYLLAGFLERHRTFGHVMTGLIVVFGWVIFAFTDMGQLGHYLLQMFGIGVAGVCGRTFVYLLLSSLLLLILAGLIATPVPYRIYRKVLSEYRPAAMIFLCLLTVVSLAYLVYQSYNPFLYFRF